MPQQQKQFGDPGYQIPEMQYIQNQDSMTPLDTQNNQEDEDLGNVPMLPEKPITDQMRETLMGMKDPVEENARLALESLKNGPDQVPLPESLKPKSVKQMLKEQLLGMVPVYGKARGASMAQQMAYDKMLYDQQKANELLEYNTRKDAAMKWHDAKIKEDQEVSTRQAKVKMLLSIYGNVPPSYIMKAAGISIPTSKQVKMEPMMVRTYGKDGKTIGEPQMAVFNPAMGVFTVPDPDTGDNVTIPQQLIASAQKIGAPGTTNMQALDSAQGKFAFNPSTGTVEPIMYGGKQLTKAESGAETPLDRQQAELEIKKNTVGLTPEEDARLRGITRARLTVPGFTSAAADQRAEDRTARTQVANALVSVTDAHRRLATMRIAAKKGDGPNDMILLSNHIAMTFGDVKGARTGQQLIEAHLNARSMPEWMNVLARRVMHGEQLSPYQRQEFLKAAQDRVEELKDSYDIQKSAWDYTPPGEAEMLKRYPELASRRGAAASSGSYKDKKGNLITKDPATGYYIDKKNNRQWDGEKWSPLKSK